MKRSAVVLLAAFVSLSGVSEVCAQQVSEDLTVTAQVNTMCEFDNLFTLNFGNIAQPVVTDVIAGTTLEFKCSLATPFVLADETNNTVGDGFFAGALNTTPANATPISYTLTYDNFTGAGLGLNSATDLIISTVTGTILQADANAALSGSYQDTVTFTLNY